MLTRVNKIFIGTNISRTASLVITGSGANAALGEVFVVDKNKQLLSPGSTINDTPNIYIGEAQSDTYSYVTETGTSVTGVRRILYSDPIDGTNVMNYSGRPYTAIAEEVVTINGTTFAPVVGTEYVLRLIYSDTYERPGQVTASIRYIAKTTVVADLYAAFVAAINKNPNRRVQASGGTTNIVLTGRSLTLNGQTDTVNAIDDYYQVNFKATLYSGNWGDVAVVYTTRPTPGNGTWQRVRDAEKNSLGYKGIMNRVVFPIITPAMRTVSGATYNTIIVEHNQKFVTPGDQYLEETQCTTEIYIPTAAGQLNDVLAVLNPWMASTPKAFDTITF